MQRRHLLSRLAAAAAAVVLPLATPAVAAPRGLPAIDVHKSPTCGCCGAWVDHLRAAGFTVNVTEVDDPSAVRRRHGLPDRFGSCHTGVVAGYVVEGHVPAADIRRLLAQRPDALGLAVPGMPVGSPGMEVGDRRDPYEVLLVDRQGRATVFARHGQAAHGAHGQHNDHEAHDAHEAAPGQANAASAGGDGWTEGEVRRVDRAQGKVTLRHGPLQALAMPAMTMVFKAADPALLTGLQPDDRVRFTADKVKGVFVVTAIEPLR